MNRRFTLLTSVTITETLANATTNTVSVTITVRPDNRSQIADEIEFLDKAGNKVTGFVNGNINYEKGIFQFQVIFNGGTGGSTYACDYATFDIRLVPVNTIMYH